MAEKRIEEKVQEIYSKAMRAAVTDEEFRAELLKDPKAAIERLTGESLPENFKLKVMEEDSEYDMTILLPPMLDDELSENELDQVAGGAGVMMGIIVGLCKEK